MCHMGILLRAFHKPLIIKEDIVFRDPVWENFPTVDGYVGDRNTFVVQGGATNSGYKYVMNLSKISNVFHYATCGEVDKMNEENKGYSNDSCESIIALGYRPCKKCNP